MCIALISTAHPSYRLIVIDNRDEYLRRPTAPVEWWPSPHSGILGGRDLARATQGTWMGVTKSGKIAVLTNYRESTSDPATGQQSRGAIVNNWLTRPDDSPTLSHVEEMVDSPTARNVGGFSLVCGYVHEPLAIVSNRSSTLDQVTWIATEHGQTKGLSNTVFDDRSWPKILEGEKLVDQAISAHVQNDEDEDALIHRLLDLLCTDSLPQLSDDATAEDYLPYFRQSIFIPLIGTQESLKAPGPETSMTSGSSLCKEAPGQGHGEGAGAGSDLLDKSFLNGPYGTQKQTVILVGIDDRVRYFERSYMIVTPILLLPVRETSPSSSTLSRD
ncbi:hypothetical protein AOCH_002706 [Aspergillus ochraceoroseus]|uniref:DUF833 domain protein n=1 Tax=Aspergillus ochraceoroseus TaxID=138278 RepID=A0A0F8UT78_9EURO|nr:hypothetical protein AOCH_002706 [Aspergillus ochraceoroseus]